MDAPLLELTGVSKAFPGVQALDAISMTVDRGEVHALLGANGAGKSTLIKILAGAEARDAGEVVFDGDKVGDLDPHAAADRGVAVLYQEPALSPFLTVEQNIFLGRELVARFGLLRLDVQRREARAILDRIAPELSPDHRVADLRASERQLVALAKALLRRPKLLILDEPTASMTDPEIRNLFTVIAQVKAEGGSIVYVTHRLEEVFAIADRATILRDGRRVATERIAAAGRRDLVGAIAGKEVYAQTREKAAEPGRPILVVKSLGRDGVFSDISFTLRAGEIVALAGLVGAGRTEIARAIFGADPYQVGRVIYPRDAGPVCGPDDAVRSGLAMAPEDRKTKGLIPKMTVADNLALSAHPRLRGRAGLIDRRRFRALVKSCMERLDIRPRGSAGARVETLSGGNQQKVVLGRALESDAEVLILDEPTAGIDIGAKAEIHRLILAFARGGKAVLLISSETEEVMALADRILVIREGALVKELEGHGASSLDVIRSALGERGPEPANA